VHDEQRLGTAMVIAIVALWFHVALGLALTVAVGSTPLGGPRVFLGLLWAAVYAAVAIGLQRRHPAARSWGIATTAVAYLIGLAEGRFISTILIVLIALLIARPPVRPTDAGYSRPPVEEESWESLRRARWQPREPWD